MNNGNPDWDHEYDVVVVGSGAGGMTAALCCQQLGLATLLVEKAGVYGGTAAVSGGGVWVPCNDQIADAGGNDSREEALTYVRHLTRGEVPDAKLESYVDSARAMVRDLAENHGVHFHSVAKYPDYFPDQPGGKPGFRTMEPAVFDLSRLGDELDRQREPYPGTLLLGRVAMTQVEAHTLLCRGPGWLRLTLKLMMRYLFDLPWRFRTRRDRRAALGQAMVGQLRHAMQNQNVPLWLNTGLTSLTESDGRVTGAVVERDGRTMRIAARRGVILASGGFEANQAMREQYLPHPTDTDWSVAPGCNHGEGIKAGQEVGAATEFMNLTWGTPSVVTPDSSNAAGLFMERQLPGCVAVNGRGERFVNEAIAYTEFVYAMLDQQEQNGAGVPCWIVFDATFRKNYPMGPMLPGMMQPDRLLPRSWEGTAYWKADSLEKLAHVIGVDTDGLLRSVADINRFAETGVDEQFGKGDNVFDRYYGDPHVKPNPCLAPITKPPFYAVCVTPGEIGTKGGLVTDPAGRVLREDGSVIQGLYATGNCSGAVMGRSYPGPGSTLGPAMTFGYLAARDLGNAEQGTRTNDAA